MSNFGNLERVGEEPLVPALVNRTLACVGFPSETTGSYQRGVDVRQHDAPRALQQRRGPPPRPADFDFQDGSGHGAPTSRGCELLGFKRREGGGREGVGYLRARCPFRTFALQCSACRRRLAADVRVRACVCSRVCGVLCWLARDGGRDGFWFLV